MIRRRALALTICSLLLQLNTTSVASACEHKEQARGSLHGATSTTAAQTTDHDHESRGEHAPCEMPPGDCCLAAASCSFTFAAASDQPSTQPALFHLVIAPRADRAPAYLIRPPEPPPPKA